MTAFELATENKKTQERFKRMFKHRLKTGYEIPHTEGLTKEERRVYLAHITLKDAKAKIKQEEERREKFDKMIEEKFPHLIDAF